MKSIILFIALMLPLMLAASELPSYEQLSNLTNPEKLSTLKKGNRSGNARLKKLMYLMHEYDVSGTKPKEFLVELYKKHGSTPYANGGHVYAPLTEKMNLEAQYRLGRLYGLYTPSNLPLLRKGNAAIVTNGEYAGEKIEIDHLIPFSKAPELENSMANLTWIQGL